MEWTNRQFSRSRIDAAGKSLVENWGRVIPDEDLTVIHNWRSCHGYPLQIVKMTLLKRARQIDSNALIAQRIKRLPSIAIKLKNESMRLSQMQDIGGCRAVLPRASDITQLLAKYKAWQARVMADQSRGRHRRDSNVFVRETDYVQTPKPDGYRSVHLIYRYDTDNKDTFQCAYNGQLIEIQIRSRLQHVWATAVEISQTFTGKALKSRVKTANENWQRFFALMGSQIAASEKLPLVPGTPASAKERIEELRHIQHREGILKQINYWNRVVKLQEKVQDNGAKMFLMILNPRQVGLEVRAYRAGQSEIAEEHYLLEEKKAENDPQVQVVLVRVDSLTDLRKAYPNYWLDSTTFIALVEKSLKRG